MKILAGLPSYNGTRWNSRVIVTLHSSPDVCAGVVDAASSMLTHLFNQMWVEALNARPAVTHFLMVHDDIIPLSPSWLRDLISEMEKSGAKAISVISPIKSDKGLTSTALESGDHWHPRRLTMKEAMERPVTWTDPGLLINTGMMLVDITEPWAERVYFTVENRIVKRNGRWASDSVTEDWDFSRRLRAEGVEPWVTRAVPILHMGHRAWRNDTVWGDETDRLAGQWQ